MPVLIDINSRDHHLFAECEANRTAMSFESSKGIADCVNIGLINNMPDPALISTERQLFDLLNAASGRTPVRLRLYTLPMLPRADWGQRYTKQFYSDVNDLWDDNLDGLIVTGAEPQAAELTAEPYWGSLEQVIDWARGHTLSAVWSCLAVHGAVFHLDGIDRHQLSGKCSGVFDQAEMEAHWLMQDVPRRLRIPHSRWNEVREGALASSGYSVLTKSADAGVDMFVKQQKKSLFVFFQGHPEYDAHSLLGEYRRDVGRFLRRETERYPTVPKGYFDDRAMELLSAFENCALSDRRKELFASFPSDRVGTNLKNTWHGAAKRIYRNWIEYLSERKPRGTKRARAAMTKDTAVSH
jgi:homoserine O-succinyltransferase